MSDILIRNMKLPKNYPYRLTLYSDGHVKDHTGFSGHGHYQAIEVQPHGELIDKDTVLDILRTYLQMVSIDADIANKVYEIVYEAPTVLEASE